MVKRMWNGRELWLRADLASLFDKAKGLADQQATPDQIIQLVLDRQSPIWRDNRGRRLSGAEVVKLPLYLAIKGMSVAAGISLGILTERPGLRPALEEFRCEA